ncbi:hypothetical protein DL240_02520 [Lujinxingia litoralis]|uniref:VOC domain-containing protein n=1 Tax=Lujinxingia litoralis TaxID=2211119 RepID=A0A328C911_9DELT|nr:SRPBCC domain-containing protein [Lujinxingia litoralis]RAL25107.1 hypothetical protein DL240_02520 [Lujinxingia litoralis]
MLGLRSAIYPVQDIDKARQWYQALLGIEPYFAEPFYVGFDVGGFELGLLPAGDAQRPGPQGVEALWGVEDIDRAWQRLLDAGARALSEPYDTGEGIRVASLADPDGNRLGIIENPHFRVPPVDSVVVIEGPATLAAEGDALEAIEVERIISAPRERVWSAWTRAQELGSWFGQDAQMELRIGGPFEIYFLDADQPARGGEGCRVLSYLPERMLSFTWNAPPDHPTRQAHTWVVVTFETIKAAEGVTRVRLVHTGWPAPSDEAGSPSTEDWASTYAYFQRAWPQVMTALERYLGGQVQA